MKQSIIIILLTALMSLVSTKASAHDIEVKNADGVTIYYSWTNDKTELSVSFYGRNRQDKSGNYSGNVVIPKSVEYNGKTYAVTSISTWAFEGCEGLKSVTIPDGVTSIFGYAFASCSMLSSITIPNSITKISYYAFSGCSNLTTITIPKSVTSIGGSAFYNTKLTDVYCYAETPPSVESDEVEAEAPYDGAIRDEVDLARRYTRSEENKYDLMSDYSNVILHVPSGSIAAYAAQEPWSKFKSIVPLEDKDVINGLNYKFTGDTKTAEVIANSDGYSGAIVIPETVEHKGVQYTVSAIGNGAFRNCTELTSISIPKSVTSVSSSAFEGCTGLVSAELHCNYVYSWFSGSSSLKELVIGKEVESIGMSAFERCSALTTVTIADGLRSIEPWAFKWCKKLTSVTIPSSVTSIGSEAFYFKAEYVGKWNLVDRGLKVNISDLVAWCNIDFGENVFSEEDGGGTFVSSSCILYYNGKRVFEIPKEIAVIKKNTFAYCSCEVTLHDGITTIGDNAFLHCTVRHINSKNLKYIGNNAFNGAYTDSWLNLPSGLEQIGNSAFASNGSILAVTIPNTVKYLGTSVFEKSTKLQKVVLPESLTRIPNRTFFGCSQLESVKIPKSVRYVGDYAFYDCSKLKYLLFESENPPTFSYYSVNYNFQIIMPQMAYEKGISSNIKNFTTYSNIPMYVEVKSTGATSAVFDIYPINTNGSLDKDNMVTVTTSGQTPGQILNWKKDKENYGIISKKANETVSLEVQAAKALSTTKARLMAKIEEADDLAHYGFEWKRYDAPEDLPASKVFAPLYNGQIMGTLKNLKDDVYYKFRPFYTSDAGETYYGEWMTFFTGDADVYFEPEIYTVGAEDITKVSALLAGVWVEGTDDFEEKGFEYWTVSGSKTRAVGSDVKTVKVSGSQMTTTVEGLKAGVEYGYRSYVKTASGKKYGEEKTFKTPLTGDITGDGKVNEADVKAISNYLMGITVSIDRKKADLNGDNKVNVADIVELVNIIKRQ